MATLAAVTTALNAFLENGDYGAASRSILARVMELTNSKMGFVGVVLEESVLRVVAFKAVAWDSQTNRQLYDAKLSRLAAQGYFDLSHEGNLFGPIMVKGQTVITNEPARASEAKGVPPGHPPIESFLGVPIFKGDSIVAVIAVANRPGGYSEQELRSLEAVSQTTAILFENYRQSTQRKKLEEQRLFLESELQKLSARHGLGDVRGRGLLLALDLKLPIAPAIVAQAFEAGLLLNAPRADTLRFMPALNVARAEILEMIDGLDAILTREGAARRVA